MRGVAPESIACFGGIRFDGSIGVSLFFQELTSLPTQNSPVPKLSPSLIIANSSGFLRQKFGEQGFHYCKRVLAFWCILFHDQLSI